MPAFASVIVLQQSDTPSGPAARQFLTLGAGAASGQYVEFRGGIRRYVMGGPTSLVGGGITVRGRYKWLGGTLGAMAGRLIYDGTSLSAAPVLGARLGPPGFFLDASYADVQPTAVPAPLIQLSLGIELSEQGSELCVGVSERGVFANVLIVSHGWELERASDSMVRIRITLALSCGGVSSSDRQRQEIAEV